MKITVGTVIAGMILGTALGPLGVMADGVPDAAIMDPHWWSHLAAVSLTAFGVTGKAMVGLVSGALGLTLWQARKQPDASS